MLELDFSGWFQCRLASDPDPADEPRGVSGWSFALGAEHDLDRVIRFHDPVDLRSHAPSPFGVFVRTVRLYETDKQNHPLVNAKFDLLDEPMFEGRNGLIAEDGREPVHPFRLEVSTGSVTLAREDLLDREGSAIHKVPGHELQRRCGRGFEFGTEVAAEVGKATGITNVDLWHRRQDELLVQDMAATRDPDEIGVLTTRLWALRNRATRRKQLLSLGGRVGYEFDVGEHGREGAFSGDPGDLGGDPDLERPWPIKFWLGGWQADVLCGYVKGTLTVPFRLPPPP